MAALPIPVMKRDLPLGPLVRVALPPWASELGVEGSLLVYSGCLRERRADEEDWERCDWLATAGHMLMGTAERQHEASQGPILSYSFRLPSAHRPMFEHAWVNRIFLFLRRWAAGAAGKAEAEIFGARPSASILLTHDVDAVDLTPEIRIKQGAFQLANAGRAIAGGRLDESWSRLRGGARFALARADFRTLARLREMERDAGLTSVLHLYGGRPGIRRGSLRRILLDPAYDVGSPYLRREVAQFRDGGWAIGLHQSFDAWDRADLMSEERQRVEDIAGVGIGHCRQHWLHFSWTKTWRAQEAAGLASDSTLGFNDRPGLRGGHALRMRPWDVERAQPMRLETQPMLFMDSHFYDYASQREDGIANEMKRWIMEVEAVGGQASVNWHPHTISETYGWGRGFADLLALLT